MSEDLKKLSSTIIDYSLKIKKSDRVQIIYRNSDCKELVKYLIKDIYKNQGIPYVKMIDDELDNLILENANSNTIDEIVKIKEYEVNNFDCFINIRYTFNEYENTNIKKEIYYELGNKGQKYDDIRVNKKRWVLLNYPSVIDAYKARMNTDEFRKYALEVMNVDYSEMNQKIQPLKILMEKTDRVRIVSPNTDISFSIKGMPAIPCCGIYNIPDGEIYTAPIKDSVNGFITYNVSSPYQGNVFEDVHLEFENGKIVNCSCKDKNEQLVKIFNTDDGSRYVGEFSFGLNPKILYPMGDILYDEKIKGSIHFTPGCCYADCDNGNKSSIHWDLVLIQRDEYGGGEIYFDDVLIRKNGMFVLDELKNLN